MRLGWMSRLNIKADFFERGLHRVFSHFLHFLVLLNASVFLVFLFVFPGRQDVGDFEEIFVADLPRL